MSNARLNVFTADDLIRTARGIDAGNDRQQAARRRQARDGAGDLDSDFLDTLVEQFPAAAGKIRAAATRAGRRKGRLQ